MKVLRYLSGALMLISGVWHGILAFQLAENRPMFAFAVAYLVIGVLLLLNNAWGIYLGLILPLAGIIAASVKIGWTNFDYAMTILIIIDFVVILTCLLHVVFGKKTAIQ